MGVDTHEVLDLSTIGKEQLHDYIQEGALHQPRVAVKYLQDTHPVLVSKEISKMEASRAMYETNRSILFQNMNIYIKKHLRLPIYWSGVFSTTGIIEKILSKRSIIVKIDDKLVTFRFKKINNQYGMVSNRHVVNIQENVSERYSILKSCLPRDIAAIVLAYTL